jgi:hypothetical protein
MARPPRPLPSHPHRPSAVPDACAGRAARWLRRLLVGRAAHAARLRCRAGCLRRPRRPLAAPAARRPRRPLAARAARLLPRRAARAASSPCLLAAQPLRPVAPSPLAAGAPPLTMLLRGEWSGAFFRVSVGLLFISHRDWLWISSGQVVSHCRLAAQGGCQVGPDVLAASGRASGSYMCASGKSVRPMTTGSLKHAAYLLLTSMQKYTVQKETL